MTGSDSGTQGRQASNAADAVLERLNDPTVAASLVTLLDHAELLSTLVLGLGAFVERGDTIIEAVADGVNELKQGTEGQSLPSLGELGALASMATDARPALETVLDSPMTDPGTLAALGLLAAATNTGVTAAAANQTTVKGIRGTLGVLKEPEVQRGMGVLVEIARALGRSIDQAEPTR